MARTIAIGDIHGCRRELEELLHTLNVQTDDELIFLGDLINRGPDTRGVLDSVQSLKNAQFVLGNHEKRMIHYHDTGDISKIKHYEHRTLEILKDADFEFFRSMQDKIYKEAFDTLFVHGGFLPHKPWQQQHADIVTWVQVVDETGHPHKLSKFPNLPHWSDLWQGPPFVVYGHTPRPNVERSTWTLGIDTECVYGGYLTAYVLPDKKIVQVPSRTHI